jgi:enamine deaminase RidA (YjgF/YER057c/UK114 family)
MKLSRSHENPFSKTRRAALPQVKMTPGSEKRVPLSAIKMDENGVTPCSRIINWTRMTPEQRFAELRLQLPPAPKPIGVYKPVVVNGNLAYVSGHGPLRADKTLITGVVGRDLDIEGGKAAARQVGLAVLATLRNHFGSLDRVRRLIKVLGMVNAAPDFYEHPKVINGCSELFADIWGAEDGVGARSAVGMGSLPGNIAVEVEAIFELR